jgi:hypothetical protein
LPVLFALLNHLLAALQKTVTFREELPQITPKTVVAAHQTATLWVNVVPMPFCRAVEPALRVAKGPLSFSANPSQIILCGGMWGAYSETGRIPKGQPYQNLLQNRLKTAQRSMKNASFPALFFRLNYHSTL